MSRSPEAVVRAVYDAFNARDLDAAVAPVAPGAALHDVPRGETYRGPEGMRAFLSTWAEPFGDARCEVHAVAADGETVFVRFSGHGTHDGVLAGPGFALQPTGRRVEIPFVDAWTVRGGAIHGLRTMYDVAALLRELGAPGPPSAESLARRWFAALSGDPAALDEMATPDCALHFAGATLPARGPDAVRAVLAQYRAAFPDLAFTVDGVVGGGDGAAVRWTAEGTNTGSLQGAPPTGRPARWTGTSVWRLEGGRVAEDWVETDVLGMMRQLGLVPAPEAAAV